MDEILFKFRKHNILRYLNQWVSGDIWQCMEMILIVTIWGEVLLVSSVEAKRLLNILQYTGQLPRAKNYLAKLSTVPARGEKSWFKHVVTC